MANITTRSPTQYKYATCTFQGKRYKRKGKTYAEAHRKLAELKVALKRGEIVPTSNTTVARWIDAWLETYKLHTVGAEQFRIYERYSRYLKNHVGGYALQDVTDVSLQKVINTGAGKGKSYVDKLTQTVRALFRQAHASGLIPRNPAANLIKPKAESGSWRALTDAEAAAVETVAQSHHAGIYVSMMMHTGLGPGEALALDWRHIDFVAREVIVERAVKAVSGRLGPPKANARKRRVPIPLEVMEMLATRRGAPDEPVFKQRVTGRRHTRSSIRRWWDGFEREVDIHLGAKLFRNKIVESALAPRFTAYCLRHTYATNLYYAGVDIKQAAEWMGHVNCKMLMEVYAHLDKAGGQTARAKLEAHLASKKARRNAFSDINRDDYR